jgi:hypothetical protein
MSPYSPPIAESLIASGQLQVVKYHCSMTISVGLGEGKGEGKLTQTHRLANESFAEK